MSSEKELSRWKHEPGSREKLKRTVSDEEYLIFILDQVENVKELDLSDEVRVTEMIDCFRCLRNRVGDPDAYSCSSWKPLWDRAADLCFLVEDLVMEVDVENSESGRVLARVAVQFLGNAVSREEIAERYRNWIWLNGRGSSFFVASLTHCDAKLRVFASMVIYNCLRDRTILEGVVHYPELVGQLLNAVDQRDGRGEREWCLFSIQKLLAEDETFVENCWKNMFNGYRPSLIQIIRLTLSEQSNDAGPMYRIHERNASFLAKIFSEEATRLVDALLESADRMLEILCEVTSVEGRYQSIRGDEKLLRSALMILRVSLDRRTPTCQKDELEKLAQRKGSSVNVEGNEQLSPKCLRTGLVRLLGNMCYKNPINQELMREHDGIALILDCMSRDADNPFITEWSIFALRNLLEHCPENQNVVASLKPLQSTSNENISKILKAISNNEKEKPGKKDSDQTN